MCQTQSQGPGAHLQESLPQETPKGIFSEMASFGKVTLEVVRQSQAHP